ncbi:hypothetical protein [Reyranella sp.]|uniref:hypothetical protein n=1 Tax=Reyranella sp. TaxID=1929291 RepID=UPI00273139F1|nr:hypothetical protein [Reyranella sp.]MDP2378271.1 hypothetical protein [Reyranella sp.]
MIKALLPALELGTLGLAFVAILAAAVLLFRRRVEFRRGIALILSAAFLMVVSSLCRLPDVMAIQSELQKLHKEVALIRGGEPLYDDVPTGGELARINGSGLKMAGLCQGGQNPGVNTEQANLGKHVKSTQRLLENIDAMATRIGGMVVAFQNPFR